MGIFQPQYIFANELPIYGLPAITACGDLDIMGLVSAASIMIDEHCGRTDGDGDGSLVYTTYQERLLASPGRNLYVIPRRPLVALSQDTITALQTLDISASGHYYTGCLPSINTLADGTFSAIIGASGRYTYNRRDAFGMHDVYSSFMSPINEISLFGGPPTWNPIDMVNLDYDSKTGELWLSAGLQLSRYNEAIVIYNSGYDPRNMPTQIKTACAAITKNLMAKGSGTTGMTSFSSSKVGVTAQFTEDVIDKNIQRLLAAFVTIRAT